LVRCRAALHGQVEVSSNLAGSPPTVSPIAPVCLESQPVRGRCGRRVFCLL